VLFIGLPPATVTLAGYLDGHPEAGFAPVGYLGHGQATTAQNGLARLGSPGDLRDAIERHRPDWIVIGERRDLVRQVNDLVELRFVGVQVEDVGAFCEKINGRVCATEVRPSELIFSESLLPDRLILKLQLLYSTVAALLAIPIALPLMGALTLLIRTRSGKPALVRERRVGFCGVPFTMYCFRSKQLDGTAKLTGVDKFIVASGLDRLPQIWNVLRGEMSLVGPQADRPEFAASLNQAIPFHDQRVLVRPGVFGWAEVHQMVDGSSRHDAVRRLEYDLYYMKNLSLLVDLSVMLQWLRNAFLFVEPKDVT
jgi:lipopolysaccharide/colanic/teichoic acid biosynthesis glycosyltransferase